MPKAKILYVSHSPYMYGAESCLVTLVQYLDKEMFEPVVVVPDEGPLKERLAALGVRTYLYRAQWWAHNENRIFLGDQDGLTRIKDLVGIIERERPDIVHSNTSVIWDGAVAAKLTGTRHVWHIHEILRGHPSITPLLPLPLLYKSLDYLSEKVVVVAAEVGAELAGSVAPEKLQIIHNGIDEARYSSAPDRSLRLELGLKPDDLVALTVASIRKYKGIDNLVEAAAQVRQRGANVKFVIAGKGPKENLAELKEKADRLGLKQDLFFLGHRTDVPRLLAGADLFVLPSLQEAFPLVVLEAMASGKPVVATDCGGTAEMIAEGESGFVVPVQDPDSLAEKILQTVSNAEQLGAMGHNALERFNQRYRADIFARNFAAVYQEVLAMEKQSDPGGQELLLINAFLEAYQCLIDHMRQQAEQERLVSDLNGRLASSDERIQQRDQLLAQREESIAQLKQWLSAREKDVRDHSRWLEEKNQMIAERDHLLSEWSKLNKSYEQRLVQRDEENTQLNERLTAHDQWMQKMAEDFARSGEHRFQLENALQKSSADLADRHRQIQEVSAALARAEQDRSQLENRLQEDSLELAERNRQIREVTAALATAEQSRFELEGRLQQGSLELADRDRRIEEVSAALARAEQDRSELERRLQQASDELASKGEQMRHFEAELLQEKRRLQELQQHTAEQLAHQDEELGNRDRLLAGLKEELARLAEEKENERQRLQAMIDAKEETIAAIVNSKSWKVTAPLRKALDILRDKE